MNMAQIYIMQTKYDRGLEAYLYLYSASTKPKSSKPTKNSIIAEPSVS
jgi:hypothetical protein